MAEALSVLADTPLPTILSLGGILFLLLAITPVKGIVVGKPSPKKQMLSGVIGSMLLVSGVAIYLIPYITSSPTPTPDATEITPLPTTTNTFSPTETQPLSVNTITPTSELPITIEEGCINYINWKPYPDEDIYKDDSGCLLLLDWGISAQKEGQLLFSVRQPTDTEEHGIYTSVPQSAIVEFTLNVEKLSTPEHAHIINIAFGIVPSDEPDPANGILYMFQTETIGQDFLYLKISEYGQKQKYLQPHYKFGEAHKIKLEIDNMLLSLSVNSDRKVADPLVIPFSPRAFWIGYTIPSGGLLSAQISGISIYPK